MISINLHQPGQLNCYVQLPNEWNELLPEEIMEIAKQQLIKGNTQPVARAALLRTLML